MWGATPESLLRHDKEGEKHDMIAYLFPGQGSQKEGMYNLFGDNAEEVSEVFDECEAINVTNFNPRNVIALMLI